MILDQVQGTHRLRAVSSVGEVFPVTSTANACFCLALLSDTEARKMAENEWERLSNALNIARATGFSEGHDDHTEGISALGFAFTDVVGDLHSVSVPIPSPRFGQQRAAVMAAMQRLRTDLLRVLGS